MIYRCPCGERFTALGALKDHRTGCTKTYEGKTMNGVWNYKILLVISNPQGISTQILHYQDQSKADMAFDQLGKAPKAPNFETSVLKLYKPVKERINYGDDE